MPTHTAASILFLLVLMTLPVTAHAGEKRCGWYDNSTPGNMTLDDKDGQWTIAQQGLYEAKGIDIPLNFNEENWVITNSGNHGYGCACLEVTTDKKTMRVIKILKARVRPLTACKNDKTLPERTDESPLN